MPGKKSDSPWLAGSASGPVRLVSTPPSGFFPLITLAPRSASDRVRWGLEIHVACQSSAPYGEIRPFRVGQSIRTQTASRHPAMTENPSVAQASCLRRAGRQEQVL
jgi:hypothetical protein